MLRSLALLLATLALAGCQAQAAPEAAPPTTGSELGADFEPSRTGSIEGVIRWEGDEPHLPLVRFFATPTLKGSVHASPHQPCVDAESHGMSDVVVFLRQVEPRRSRPWHHAPVRVEHERRELRIVQDGKASLKGFVRRGDAIEVWSGDTDYHCLRGRGAAFFGIPLPDRDVISHRRLDQPGVVELSSAAGFYWMSAHLFVADHPYFARSDAQGRFRLEQVPEGTYELVCWLPSCVSLGHERDPESGLICRLILAPPREQKDTVHVVAGQGASASFTWSCQRLEHVRQRND